jgi:hypothetical protein
MATQVQRRKGTTVQHSTFTGASAELTVDSTKNTVVVHDGATAGGFPLAKESGSALSPSSVTLSGGTANGVAYLNGSKVLTTGSALTFDGTNLTATNGATIQGLTVGRGAGAVATNTAVGVNGLYSNTTGANNVAIGYTALQQGNGSQNTAIGSQAAFSVTGSANTYVGFQAGNTVTSGASNVGIGKYAGGAQTTSTGSENAAVGTSALTNLTSGNYNTAVGTSALQANTTASSNTAVGYQAAYSNTTGTSVDAFGSGALYANTTGTNNAGFAAGSLVSNTTGSSNSAFGRDALRNNTTASNNTAVGYQAGYSGTVFASGSITALGYKAAFGATAGRIVAIGEGALTGTTTGDANVAVGYYAGNSNISGTLNTYAGDYAAYGATGSGNTVVGARAGYLTLTTGANNVLIGYAAGVGTGTDSQSIVIGYNSTGKGANTGFINPGTGGVYQGNNSSTWSITSDERIKKNIVNNDTGLSLVNQIQVRNFEYRLPEEITDLPQEQAVAKQGVQLGVIAQELQQILPECVKTESTGVMTVDADNLTWYLVNAVKELSAQVAQLQSQLKG